MILKDILHDANLLVPNSLADDIKVRWLNEIQAQLYRDFPFPFTVLPFVIGSGKSIYPMPDDCSRERIISLVVDEEIYEYRSLDQTSTDCFWTLMESNIFIHPTPTKDSVAILTYRPRPKKMRIDMLDEKPGIHEDFHEILVYGIGIRLANVTQNFQRSQELKITYDELHETVKRELRSARNKKVLVNREWR